MARQIFYSFHFENDVMRVQQIRNIGAIEGNKPVLPQKWEEIKTNGDAAVKKWINENMKNKSCVVVLVGQETANRKWVRYEILKAWKEEKALLGIHIHNIKCPNNGKSSKGSNPFDNFLLDNGKKMSEYVECIDPILLDPYNHIADNIEQWINNAIKDVSKRR